MDNQPQPPAMETPPPPVAGAGAYPPAYPGGLGWYPPPPPPKPFNPLPLILLLACALPTLLGVLGIVASIAIPILLSANVGRLNEQARNTARMIATAEVAYFAEHNEYGTLEQLKQAGSLGALPSGGRTGKDVDVTLEASGSTYRATVAARGGRTPYLTYRVTEDGTIQVQADDASASAAGP